MTTNLLIPVSAPTFDTADAQSAEDHAANQGGTVYTWKSIGRANWLERGYSRSDALALVVLPPSLPDTIDLPDDRQ